MFTLIIQGALIVMAIGLIAKYFLDFRQSIFRIDHIELCIASAILLLIIVPLTSWIGTKLAISNLVTYNENWGGYETGTQWIRTPTSRDGNMKWSYKGDPYQYVWYTTETETTGSGKNAHTRTYQQRHEETRYHDIPYCTEEWTLVVNTTLGDYVIADRNLPDHPNNYRYRAYESVPEDLPHGIPDFWTEAKKRLSAGEPGPVTARRTYENYILASEHTILKRYSKDIKGYAKEGLLPQLSHKPIFNFYYADRAYFVNLHPGGDWQGALNRFNAALGNTRQGDLHLVFVDADKVSDPDNYVGALIAYWQSPVFEKDALSKNGILVVVGSSDKQTVKWARAVTPMPTGNEQMVLDIQNGLVGAKLTTNAIVGAPTVNFSTGKWTYTDGALEKAILQGPHAFTRVHMGAASDKGSTGYAYLLREIEPKGWQRWIILVVSTLFGCVAWTICIMHGAPSYRASRFGR